MITEKAHKPRNFEEAMSSKDKDKWIVAMQEVDSLQRNNTSEMTSLPENREAIVLVNIFQFP